MNFTLKVWRQRNKDTEGRFESYPITNVTSDMSFLEMLDFLNEDLIKQGVPPVEFESDCREGICGTCSCVINGQAHGPVQGTTTCQLYMRSFKDGETLVIEPWKIKSFPILRDLVVDRGAFDRIIKVGGYTGAKVGLHADANAMLISKDDAEHAMDAAACIGCGACAAACPNSSASLFTAAKITHMALLPQGAPLRERRVIRMVEQMDKEGFGHCTSIGECQSVCPKEIKIDSIVRMKHEYMKALAKS